MSETNDLDRHVRRTVTTKKGDKMGADMYFNPPRDERNLWEKVREVEETNNGLRQKVHQMEKIIKDKNAEIDALRTALRSLGGQAQSFVRDA